MLVIADTGVMAFVFLSGFEERELDRERVFNILNTAGVIMSHRVTFQ